MRIGLIRHGLTKWNADGIFQGSSNTELSPLGVEQAEDAGQLLVDRGWTRLYSSPLQRARQTADIIGELTGLGAPELVEDLVERNFGDLEGKPYWAPDGTRVPLNDSVETVDSVVSRTTRVLASIAEGGSDALVVCHGTVIRLFLDRLLAPRQSPRVNNLSLTILDGTPDAWRVPLLNGYPHD